MGGRPLLIFLLHISTLGQTKVCRLLPSPYPDKLMGTSRGGGQFAEQKQYGQRPTVMCRFGGGLSIDENV